ncbi:unnamed protein product [Penicillium nalgiovense]|uniref:Extracellular membrane protein CFEM domain-containing protein n=1 Tax=Penicillium nalgiovense TaxID=60175 RepID=A0A9W4MVA9_PENNA|nr:unnamed protein product [Penicillium nalgiovense]CAG7977485.1 unnamed protein product [Penicillium nalgiovense]CAG7982703.1 unnamed protein product [Penicillium nalgiovense]CAG7985481.1 unnamed protein product [Penicillium nalgiovense]CAG8004891.1 unnamed protein product [Penicillium nalgiovense]
MKFSFLALSALLAVAAAADTTTANASIITSTPEVECAKSSKDICCTASCYHVPCPSDEQANDTNKCVAACPQGTGSPADTQKYAECERSCYSSHFWGGNGSGATATHSTTSTGTGSTANQTNSDSSSTGSKASGDNDSNDNSDNDASSSSGTATSSSGSSQETTNAAANVKLGVSAAGLFGLVVAAFAL